MGMLSANDEELILGATVGTLTRLKELLVPRLREDSAGTNENVSVGASGRGVNCFSSFQD